MNEVCAAALLADFRPRHAFDRAFAEAAGIGRDLLLQRITGKCRQHGPAARQDAEHRTKPGAAQYGAPGVVEILLARPEVLQPGAELRARKDALLQIADDLDDAEHADHQRHEVDAVPQLRDAEGVAREPAVDVGADETQQQANQHHAHRLDHRAVREHDGGDEAEHHQGKIVGRVEFLRDRRQRRAEGGDEDRADAAGEERSERSDRKRGPGAPLLCHLVAVDAGDDGRRLARNVDQDRGGRTAVLRAVIDAGEHDERRQRPEPEGDRQQHRDGGDRADARQHPDQRAEQAAEQRETEIVP